MKQFSSLVAKLCPTLATPQTVAYGVPLSMGFSRQEYWSGKALTKSRSEPRVIEHISKALLGHPLWGCLLDITAPACLSPADQVTSLLGSCSTATTYSVLDFLFSTRPVGMKASSQLLAPPHPAPSWLVLSMPSHILNALHEFGPWNSPEIHRVNNKTSKIIALDFSLHLSSVYVDSNTSNSDFPLPFPCPLHVFCLHYPGSQLHSFLKKLSRTSEFSWNTIYSSIPTQFSCVQTQTREPHVGGG